MVCGAGLSSRDVTSSFTKKKMVKNNLKGKINRVTFCPTLACATPGLFDVGELLSQLCLDYGCACPPPVTTAMKAIVKDDG